MAKKKKQTRRKKIEQVERERSVMWPVIGIILFFVTAILLLLGALGASEGWLTTGLFEAVSSAFGWVAYLVPFALVFFGIHKMLNEEKKLPKLKLLSMVLVLVMAAAWMHTAFVTKSIGLGQVTEYRGGNGGAIGAVVGGLGLSALDKIPASILFFMLTVLSLMWAFNVSPRVFIDFFAMFRRDEDDTDLEDLRQKAEGTGFKLNEGVPMEHHTAKSRIGSSLRNSAAQQLAPAETHAALTTSRDPDWQFPSVTLLNQKQDKADAGDVEGNAELIKETFNNFSIDVEMEGANVGPRVTQYTLKPPNGVKLTKITALENNLALDLAAHSIRMEAPIPGKRAVGIEVPNVKPAIVRIASLLQSREWSEIKSPLGFVIGKDIAGTPVVADLAKMPHLLVAGQTGSGKSVMINTILTSLLYRNSPSDLKLILVDPKQVELKPYDELPHLLTSVIVEPEKCISALKWAVAEMERRYKALADERKRNIVEYNAVKKEEGMPYIVIVIDELADLMMMAARDVEALIVRIAQKARAVGIHLVLATQRPSVDVITGLIKANVPARIAFTTASQVDSRTIIDQIGSEKLLGQGDMLLLTADMPKPKRVQGAFIDDNETNKVTDFIRMQRAPNYDDEIISQPVQLNGKGGVVADYGGQDADDDMFKDAVQVVIDGRKASTSLLQRRLRVGYARAARMIETMEEQGIVGPADGSRPRDVLVKSMDEVFGGGVASEGEVYDDMPDEAEA